MGACVWCARVHLSHHSSSDCKLNRNLGRESGSHAYNKFDIFLSKQEDLRDPVLLVLQVLDN